MVGIPLGVYDRQISEIAKCSMNDKYLKNASRNLFQFIHRKGKTLPVTISSIPVPVRGRSRHKHLEQIKPWLVLLFSDWVKAAFQPPYNGFYLLGGHKPGQMDLVKGMLRRFWQRYKLVDRLEPKHPEITVPFFLHGDEGRGQCHRPVLVLAVQPALGSLGEECVTSKKNLVICLGG